MSRIDPGAIPGASLDVETVRTGASGLSTSGGTIRDQGAAIVRDWQKLPASFEATGTEGLYAAMTPVGTTTTTIGDSLDGIARALHAYADEVEPIKARLDALRSQAVDFVAQTKSFSPHVEWISSGYTLGVPLPEQIDSWDQDPDLNDTNNSLIRQVAAAEADWLDAQQRCATAIRAAVGIGATGAADERAIAKQLRSGDALSTTWGATSDRKESCSEKAVTFQSHFLWDGIVVGFGWNTLKGIGALVGIDPTGKSEAETWNGLWKGLSSGDWSQYQQGQADALSSLGNAWLGVAHIASAIAIPVDPATRMSILNSGALDWLPKDITQGAKDWTAADGTALYGTVLGLVGLNLPAKWWNGGSWKADQVFSNWTENPGGAAGTSVGNIGSFFIPGVGELKAAGVTGDAARLGAAGAHSLEGMRLGDVIANGSIDALKGLPADVLKSTIKGLSDADAARLAAELAKPELDAGALSSLRLDDFTIHAPDEPPALVSGATDEHPATDAAPADREPALVGADRSGTADAHASADAPRSDAPADGPTSTSDRAADDGRTEVRDSAGDGSTATQDHAPAGDGGAAIGRDSGSGSGSFDTGADSSGAGGSGAGTFDTGAAADAGGRPVVEVRLGADDATPLMNGHLAPDTVYEVEGRHGNTFTYETDGSGLVHRSSAEFDTWVPKDERVRDLGEQAGIDGREAGDHAGHIWMAALDGPEHGVNLTAQARVANLKFQREMENVFLRELRDAPAGTSQHISARVEILREPGDVRPFQYDFQYRVGDGRWIDVEVPNPRPAG